MRGHTLLFPVALKTALDWVMCRVPRSDSATTGSSWLWFTTAEVRAEQANLVSVSVAHLFCTHDHSMVLWRPHRDGEGLEFSPLPRREAQRRRSPKTSPTGVLTYGWDTIQPWHSVRNAESTGPKRDTGGIQVHGTLGNSQVPLCHTWEVLGN